MANIRINSHRTQHIDLKMLPYEETLKGARGLGVFLIIFALFWGGIPTVVLVNSIQNGEFELKMLFMLIFTIVGSGLLIGGIYQFFVSGKLMITHDQVIMDKKTLFGHENWMEPIANYEGVMKRSVYRSGGKNSSSYTEYMLDLKHRDNKKDINIYRSRSSRGIREIWEESCRILNLPALENAEGELYKRDVNDLDKSIVELIKEKKIRPQAEAAVEKPDTFNISHESQGTVITINKQVVAPGWQLFMLLFPCVFIYIGFFVDDGPLLFGFVGIFFEILFIGVVVFSWVATPKFVIGRDFLEGVYLTPWGPKFAKRMEFRNIEQIAVKGSADNSNTSPTLVFETDQQTYRFGYGLSKKELYYMKAIVLQTISQNT